MNQPRETRVPPGALVALYCAVALVAGTSAAAQSAADTADPSGAAAPVPVLEQDAEGRVVVRATRITEPIRVDGRLDETAYAAVRAITQFVQQEPIEGAPVTENTEAWVMFDDENIYFACRCWHEDPGRIVANDMRRDNDNLSQHDSFGVQLDPFHDGRSAFFFYMSPIGAIRDAAVTDEQPNVNWNTVWSAKAARFDGGWISEIAIPFKSLRYPAGRQQTWRIQIRRVIPSKNERVHITPLSAAWGPGGWNHMASAATLVGLEAPPPSRNLEIKPYVISRVATDTLSRPAVRNDFDPDAGFDVKYGVTKSLTADFTYNTDFAQVEADEAQVNLTRFNLSFPEQREFFLEGGGIFRFGARGEDGDAPVLFYSRRIGLSDEGRALPVIAGGRLTGKVGPWTVGALNIAVDDDAAAAVPLTNFTVVRLRRNVFRRSVVGGLFTRRSASTIAPGANHVWGLDANLAFYEHLYVSGSMARSWTEGLHGDDLNYRAGLQYEADRYGLTLDGQVAEENFNPEVGFMRRENFRRGYAQARFSPRTTSHPLVRKWIYQGSADYVTDNDHHLESRELLGEFQMDFHTSDSLAFRYARLYEFLPKPFPIGGVSIPAGGYSFDNAIASFTAGQRHRVSGTASFEVGGFYGGDKKTAELNGRIGITPQLGVEPNISLNWIDLPQGRFRTTVLGGRATFTMTPRMFFAALVQHSSSSTSLSTNLRFRWEYQPGSELFVVYTEGRSTLPPRGTELQNRGFVVKINRLFRF